MRTSFFFRAARLSGLGLAILLAVTPLSLRADTDPCPDTKVGTRIGAVTTGCDSIDHTCSIFNPDDFCIPSSARTKCIYIVSTSPKGYKSNCTYTYIDEWTCHAAWGFGVPYGSTVTLAIAVCAAIAPPPTPTTPSTP